MQQSEIEAPALTASRLRNAMVPLVVTGFSLFYFADVLLRASEKYFWADEIFTLHMARLGPTALWHALAAGTDNNPPLFYWLTRLGEIVGGQNQIGVRLPEIIAFWIFCLCLFRFVSRIAGPAPGFIAMLSPMLTGAYYYAYEARPHGIALGFAGLSMVCWQMAESGHRRRLWLTLLSFSLFGALMNHCYAVVLIFPFALAELVQTMQTRRLDLGMWTAILLPLAPAIPVYAPLTLAVHDLLKAEQIPHIPAWREVARFYRFLVNPALPAFLLALLILSFAVASTARKLFAIPVKVVVLGLGFLAIPAVGVLLVSIIHTPYMFRYFIPGLAGFCFFLAVAFRWWGVAGQNIPASAFAAVLVVFLLFNFVQVGWERLHNNGYILFEPAAGFAMNTTPNKPLDREELLTAGTQDPAPIATANVWEFVYVSFYSPELRRRFYYVDQSANTHMYQDVKLLVQLGVPYNTPVVYRDFLNAHPRCYLFGGIDVISRLSKLMRAGWQIRSLRRDEGQVLALIERPQTKGTP